MFIIFNGMFDGSSSGSFLCAIDEIHDYSSWQHCQEQQ